LCFHETNWPEKYIGHNLAVNYILSKSGQICSLLATVQGVSGVVPGSSTGGIFSVFSNSITREYHTASQRSWDTTRFLPQENYELQVQLDLFSDQPHVPGSVPFMHAFPGSSQAVPVLSLGHCGWALVTHSAWQVGSLPHMLTHILHGK
jgi:hypothetical protein